MAQHGPHHKGCEACKPLRAEYVRNKRRTEGDIPNAARTRAVEEAARRYREEHPLEYAQLVADYKSELRNAQ